MFRVSHRRCPQLLLNGSLNQHMAKQVSFFQTPVKTWLPMLANQSQPRRDMAVEGTTWNPEGHPTPDQLCSYTTTLRTVRDTTALWPRKGETCQTIRGQKRNHDFFFLWTVWKGSFRMPLKCLSKHVGFKSEVGWTWIQLRFGFFSSISDERWIGDVCCRRGGGRRAYRQGNLCNLFTRPWEAHKDEWEQGQLLFSHSSPNLYW